MSEEEKKAITYLKFYIERDVMYEDTHYEQIKTILNLINKQQKEIVKLKEKNTDLEKDFRTYTRKVINSVFQDEFIHKDKIREKIKEINQKSFENKCSYSEYYYKKEVLKELLDDEI